jgi:hypothetical protein
MMAKMSGNARRAILSPSGEILGWEEIKKPTKKEIEAWAKSDRGQAAYHAAIKNKDPWDIRVYPTWSEKRGYHWVVRVNPY